MRCTCGLIHLKIIPTWLKNQRFDPIEGVANGTSKNVGLGKFWQDLEILETFLISQSLVFSWFVFTFFES